MNCVLDTCKDLNFNYLARNKHYLTILQKLFLFQFYQRNAQETWNKCLDTWGGLLAGDGSDFLPLTIIPHFLDVVMELYGDKGLIFSWYQNEEMSLILTTVKIPVWTEYYILVTHREEVQFILALPFLYIWEM